LISEETLRQNCEQVRARIAAACARASRDPSEITLLPITKTHPPEACAALHALNLPSCGENRAQELRDKVKWFADSGLTQPHWHFVGSLQKNKVKYLIGARVTMIHSIDSVDLAREIEKQAARVDLNLDGLLEVNVSAEASKHGLSPADAAAAAREILAETKHLRLRGLMTMAPFTDDPEETRPVFRNLRMLRDELQEELDGPLPVLSMGMSNDFEVAVEEGATLVRVGTAILGAREGTAG
jgi:hypothetical protein